jgi:glycosyltransferase involved in cell wall biosynthesis
MESDYNYSVLISVYHKELPSNLIDCFESIFFQTKSTNDLVLMCDGPLTKELDEVIAHYQEKYPDVLKVYRLEKNLGLGIALSIGVQKCKNEFIARMDSDDIASSNRCEKELHVITKGYDIVGSNIAEFIDNIENVIAIRVVPEHHKDIVKFAKKRNPYNHPSVMYRRSKVLEAGNYRDVYRLEDYYLWIDMINAGCKGYNIQENLVHMRSTDDMYKRRSGKALVKSLFKLRKYMLDNGIINKVEFMSICSIQTMLAIIPNSLRSFLYKEVLRK